MTKQNLLIVDDEESILKLLNLFLKDSYNVTKARSAEEALLLIKEEQFDTIISDQKMSGDSGLELLEKVQKIKPDLPFILMTGHGDKEHMIQSIKIGVYDFLEKPIDDKELQVAVGKTTKQYKLVKENKKVVRELLTRSYEVEALKVKLNLLSSEMEDKTDAHLVAHEVRNPLTIILGNVQALKRNIKKKPLDFDKVNKSMDRIEKGINLACDVIGSALENSKEIASRIKEENVVHLINESIDLCREYLTECKVQINFTYSSYDTRIDCHHIQFKQVIVNLIRNSIDSIRKLSEKWITVDLIIEDRLIKIVITDSGKKISKDLQEIIFLDHFTTKSGQGGSGIGLYLSKEIIEISHNGSLYYNDDSEHASFIIQLQISD